MPTERKTKQRRVRFTDRWIKALKRPESGDVEWYDSTKGSPAAFGLRVFATGTKSFFIVYRRHGRKRRFALGKYPSLTLAEARTKAKAIDGNQADPSADRERSREIMSFTLTAKSFLEDADFRPSTHTEYERIINRTLVPKLGAFRLDQITRADVRAILRGIAKEHPHMANRVHAVVRQVFNYAVREERIAASPIAGMAKPAFTTGGEPKRDRVLDADEIVAVWRALEKERPLIANYFRLLFLTGCRKTETLKAEWKHIDSNERLWRIPDSSTKQRTSHEVPLSPAAWDVLQAVRQLTGNKPYVFVGPTGKPILNPNKAKLRIQDNAGVKYRIHDIRRTVATNLARIGVRSESVSAILGHAIGRSATTRIYERYERLPEKRAALEKWASELERIVSGVESAAVIEFPVS